MSKKDLFVCIYCSVWASLIVLMLFVLCYWTNVMNTDSYVILANVSFLGVTSVMVLVEPVRKWVDKHIIDRL